MSDGQQEVCQPACKPGSVPRPEGAATVIYLALWLPTRSSSLPESRNGPDQPCSLIWPCSRWGLPSQPVTRLLVGSYPAISPLLRSSTRLAASFCERVSLRARRSSRLNGVDHPSGIFLLHFPYPSAGAPRRGPASDGGRYPPPCPAEPGLTSPRLAAVKPLSPGSGRPANPRTALL